ncbi:putative bifunctional diguanylate cyclase/phosphodiesterase [Kineococcus xinjiangensis]|uniref:putative bifunctional diguanylate cyclase/phosphodiesterase n=1 Tax=Kineococcus xinjiangensis TaxID=512762 RepID=UPI0011B0E7A8|nr:EAL domain-containing protein [Kineococcus xinjiangensis]
MDAAPRPAAVGAQEADDGAGAVGTAPGAGIDPRLALADAVAADAEAWVVHRAVRDDAGGVVDFEAVWANEAAVRTSGLGPMVGRRLLEMVPEIADSLFPVFRSVVDSGEPQQLMTPAVVSDARPSWRPGWTAFHLRAVGDLLVVHWRDATEEHGNALAAAAAETRLQALLQNADEVIGVYTKDAKPLYLSPSARRVLGTGAPSAHFAARVHVEDRPLVMEVFATLLAGGPGQVVEVEARLQHGDGHWMWVHARGTNHVDDPDVGGIVINLRDITEQHDFAEQLRRQALQDPLTSLPNRRLIDTELERALARTRRGSELIGVLLCDVDHFKSINDLHGHPAGDELLQQFGRRLSSAVRPADIVGRLGGDEFIVVCEDLADVDDLRALTARIRSAVCGDYDIAGRDVSVTVTFGASAGRHPDSSDEVLSQADTALYEAKRAGRDRVEVFDHRIHQRQKHRSARESALRTALGAEEFRLHYQPVIDLRSDRVVGAEALLRWDHPQEGLLLPAAFLGLAEESNLIVDIGAWVLRAAMAEAAGWSGDDGGRPWLSINVSGRQLAHPDLLLHLDAALLASGLDPARVEIEITETVALHDLDATQRVLTAVRARGLHIALDDFGTGYSSLTWLQRLPVDTVKLDRSFVADLLSPGGRHTPSIIGGVTALAHAMGKHVIAEGIESTQQRDHLVELGCDYAQGYLFHHPAPHGPFG